jgi:hypothetical protein
MKEMTQAQLDKIQKWIKDKNIKATDLNYGTHTYLHNPFIFLANFPIYLHVIS